jgi:sugar lactone lactonase YvrE
MAIKKIIFLLVPIISILACSPAKNKVELVSGTKSQLGEGAIWNYRTSQLYWVDITGKLLNIYTPRLDINRELYTGQLIGTVVPAESGKVLLALEHGFYFLDPETGTKHFIIHPEEEPDDNRFNDGKCDPAGRFWAGTMNTQALPGKGSLYRLDPDTAIHRMVENVSISNGIAWSLDHTRMYYIDTPTQSVVGYDFDNSTGEIRNGRRVIEIPENMGHPDGMTIDSEGNLWICLWGGAAVGCWNPGTGELVRKIDVPVKNVTSCAFGDSDLGTLYITTASIDTNPEELKKYPDAGSLFRVRPGVTGIEAFFFADKPVTEALETKENDQMD